MSTRQERDTVNGSNNDDVFDEAWSWCSGHARGVAAEHRFEPLSFEPAPQRWTRPVLFDTGGTAG